MNVYVFFSHGEHSEHFPEQTKDHKAGKPGPVRGGLDKVAREPNLRAQKDHESKEEENVGESIFPPSLGRAGDPAQRRSVQVAKIEAEPDGECAAPHELTEGVSLDG